MSPIDGVPIADAADIGVAGESSDGADRAAAIEAEKQKWWKKHPEEKPIDADLREHEKPTR